MTRIVFTGRDLVRLRMKISLGPAAETVFALRDLRRAGGGAHEGWRERVHTRLRADPALARLLPRSSADDLLHHVDRSRRAPKKDTSSSADLLEIWRIAIAPYWGRMFTYLDAECDARGRAALTEGVESLLSTLHPRIRWDPPVLDVPGGPAGEELRLDGNGLVLSPSLFLVTRPGVVLGAERLSGRPALVFAAPPDRAISERIWQAPQHSGRALAALVGMTRAAALRVLTDTCTTGQLAERLGISCAGASQHTAVLRQNGLITTRRVRNTALHTVTPLGAALLGGDPLDGGR
ncbi:ArsR/SmtB family transcription factor [Lentzea sp. E54]|uniref:ArsR/SmtB family transcription factor n=1 Tax=Lentzea xerophila TaxID=3435883 RepID=UPI003DA6A763